MIAAALVALVATSCIQGDDAGTDDNLTVPPSSTNPDLANRIIRDARVDGESREGNLDRDWTSAVLRSPLLGLPVLPAPFPPLFGDSEAHPYYRGPHHDIYFVGTPPGKSFHKVPDSPFRGTLRVFRRETGQTEDLAKEVCAIVPVWRFIEPLSSRAVSIGRECPYSGQAAYDVYDFHNGERVTLFQTSLSTPFAFGDYYCSMEGDFFAVPALRCISNETPFKTVFTIPEVEVRAVGHESVALTKQGQIVLLRSSSEPLIDTGLVLTKGPARDPIVFHPELGYYTVYAMDGQKEYSRIVALDEQGRTRPLVTGLRTNTSAGSAHYLDPTGRWLVYRFRGEKKTNQFRVLDLTSGEECRADAGPTKMEVIRRASNWPPGWLPVELADTMAGVGNAFLITTDCQLLPVGLMNGKWRDSIFRPTGYFFLEPMGPFDGAGCPPHPFNSDCRHSLVHFDARTLKRRVLSPPLVTFDVTDSGRWVYVAHPGRGVSRIDLAAQPPVTQELVPSLHHWEFEHRNVYVQTAGECALVGQAASGFEHLEGFDQVGTPFHIFEFCPPGTTLGRP